MASGISHYCTAAEVKSAIDFPATGAPISDADITVFISESEEEIENIYKTKFGNVETSATAASGDATTITVAGTPYTADEFIGYVVWVYDGTNVGEYREITTNTDNDLTVSPAFSAAIDNTSVFRITKLGYQDETVDGSGIDTQFTNLQPLISLNALTIDSTSVTPSYVYQYGDSGRLLLGTGDVEVSYFADNEPQLVNMKYVYGVYPLPLIIKRLCVILAAMRTLTAQIAGTYDDFTNVSLPGGVTASKGEPYTNIREAVSGFQGEARGIIYGSRTEGQIGGGLRIQPSYRPYSLFG